MKWIRVLGALLLSALLAACGGGNEEVASQPQATSIVHPLADLSKATDNKTTLDGRDRRFIIQAATYHVLKGQGQAARKQALAASAPSPGGPAITVEELLNWAEVQYPTLFPAGPTTVRLSFNGQTFDARTYANGNALGVTPEGAVYAYGTFTLSPNGGPLAVGVVGDYACQVKPVLCSGGNTAGVAGVLQLSKDSQVLIPTDGKWRYLGKADGSSGEVATSDIAKVCWNSDQTGWQSKAQACAVPAEDGAIWLSGKMCNNGRGLVTLVKKDGTEYWFDFTSALGWKLAGDLAPRVSFGKIEYGKNGYQPAKVSARREADNTITLVVDFGSDCVAGFGKDNELTQFERDTQANPLMFAWHSNQAGVNRQPGWGWGPTVAAPTVHTAWADFDQTFGKYILYFKGMACADQGSVTVYKHLSITQAEDGTKQVVYNPGTDNFGAGWLIVPGPNDTDPIFQTGPGIVWDPVNFRITWDFALCKVPPVQ